MYLSKKFEDLTFSDDFLFGIIMRNPKYCKPFLETILNVRISRIEYPEGQKPSTYLSMPKVSVWISMLQIMPTPFITSKCKKDYTGIFQSAHATIRVCLT